MAVTVDNILHQNKGTTSATTSHVVSLAGGDSTTAGTQIVVAVYLSSSTLTAPSGFVLDSYSAPIGFYRKFDVAAGETSWTFTTGAAADLAWQVFEISGLDPVEPMDVATGGGGSLASGGTRSSGTTARTAGLSVLVLAAFGATKATGATTSWTGYTNGFEEIDDESQATPLVSLAVAQKSWDGTTSTFETTATLTRSDAANAANARIIAYREADAPVFAPVLLFTSFGWGTHAGMGNTTPSNPLGNTFAPTGTWGTNYLISSSYARSGYASYGLRIVDNASVALVQSTSPPVGCAAGVHVRPISGSGVCVAAYLDSSGTDLQLVYDFTNNKWGLRWGAAGTASYQSGTTALNAWAWVDLAGWVPAGVHTSKWRLETGTNTYTDQTAPADLTGQTARTIGGLTLGPGAAQTATFEYSVPVFARYWAAYPMEPHKGQTLVPETTGASVSGTSSNFSKFTANGTLAAWASDAGSLLDDLPPTISASADGVVQTTTAASDYAEFPMTNPTVASDEVIAAVRSVNAMWGGTGTGTGQLGLRVYDGVTETVVDAGTTTYDADSLTTASATYPLWRAVKLITAPDAGWTLTRANALVTRMGYSADATPDMGAHALYIEVATRKADVVRQITMADPISATVDLYMNPYSSASVSYVVTNNDATRSVNFNYSISGTPQTPVTVSPSSNQTVTVNMDAFGDIDTVGLEPQ